MTQEFHYKPITFRPAMKTDGEFILHVEETMRGYAEALWGSWSPSSTLEKFDHSGHYLIEIDSISVGCLALIEDTQFLRIKKLYLEPNYQRLGIGAKALAWVNQMARDKGLITTLSVLRTNPAKSFYVREGFTVTSETRERFQMMRKTT